ncbi:hypothetical protein ACH4E9_28830 [Streptomyces anulatus]
MSVVIAQVRGIGVERKVVDDSAKMQGERIKKAAAGSKPRRLTDYLGMG